MFEEEYLQYLCNECCEQLSFKLSKLKTVTLRFKNEIISEFIQPERSKREDSQKCEMRCSEHCGNTVRDK